MVFPLLFISAAGVRLEGVTEQVIGSAQSILRSISRLGEGSWNPASLLNYLPVSEDGCTDLRNGALDRATWTISTDTFCPNHFSTAAYVANGYFGQTLPSEAVGYWTEKRPDGSLASNGDFTPRLDIGR